ncbi:MAG: recombinase RecA [Deltaproteobacteria bacterium]|nr:MAG: recombinase RecA [Deltaproteobacteria bacterium]
MLKKKKQGGGIVEIKSLLNKRFGEGTIMLADDEAARGVEVFSSGSVSIDLALGIGGFPKGRVVEIYGPESSGKTTLCLQAIAEAQKAGFVAAFIDAENAIDLAYARNLGVDTSTLLLSQPSSGEDALDIVDMLTRSGEVGLIVVDSVAALTPRAEIEGEMGDSQVGLQARLMGKALRKVNPAVGETGTTIIFINQLRQKIGVTFGSGETTTGGNALKFYASMRLDIRRIGALKDGDEAFGNRTRVKVVKNKLAPPFQKCEFDIIYGRGVCQAGELLDLGVEHGVIEKSGAWYAWDGERLGQGRERSRAALIDAPDRLARLKTAVLAAVGASQPAVDAERDDDDIALAAA